MKKQKNRKFKSLVRLFSDRKRWVKGKFATGHGAYCLLGGIEYLYTEINQKIARARIMDAINTCFPHKFYNIASFNDHPDTTRQDVLKVCRRARV